MCVCECVRVSVCVCVCACVHMLVKVISLYWTGVDRQFFVENSLGEVEDEHRAIAGSHGNQRSIVEPVLGGERWAHSKDHWCGGDTTP